MHKTLAAGPCLAQPHAALCRCQQTHHDLHEEYDDHDQGRGAAVTTDGRHGHSDGADGAAVGACRSLVQQYKVSKRPQQRLRQLTVDAT